MNEWISVLLRTFGIMIFHLNILAFRALLQLHLALMGAERAQLITGREA